MAPDRFSARDHETIRQPPVPLLVLLRRRDYAVGSRDGESRVLLPPVPQFALGG